MIVLVVIAFFVHLFIPISVYQHRFILNNKALMCDTLSPIHMVKRESAPAVAGNLIPALHFSVYNSTMLSVTEFFKN